MIVYLARDISSFVMYCVYGESRVVIDSIYKAVGAAAAGAAEAAALFSLFIKYSYR